MFDISPLQVVIVLAIALLIFGPRRLPEIGRGIGRGIRDFRTAIGGTDTDHPEQERRETPTASPASPLAPTTARVDDVSSVHTAEGDDVARKILQG